MLELSYNITNSTAGGQQQTANDGSKLRKIHALWQITSTEWKTKSPDRTQWILNIPSVLSTRILGAKVISTWKQVEAAKKSIYVPHINGCSILLTWSCIADSFISVSRFENNS